MEAKIDAYTTKMGNDALDEQLKQAVAGCSFRRASVAVILFEVSGKVHVLLTRRNLNMRSHPGETAFPGGKQDPTDIDEVDCALREMNEEIGLKRELVTRLPLESCPQISKHKILVTPVLFRLEAEVVRSLPAAGVPFHGNGFLTIKER